MDKVFVRGMRFFGRHGVLKAERELGQRFVVDVEAGTCLRAAAKTDDVQDTVNYVALRDTARRVVEEGPSRNLVETVAAEIAAQILDEHSIIDHVRVNVSKPHVAVHNVDSLGVEVFRSRPIRE